MVSAIASTTAKKNFFLNLPKMLFFSLPLPKFEMKIKSTECCELAKKNKTIV